jgi:hypothetical protein
MKKARMQSLIYGSPVSTLVGFPTNAFRIARRIIYRAFSVVHPLATVGCGRSTRATRGRVRRCG